jgi:hypothetical protein
VGAACPPPPNSPLQKKDNWSPKKMPAEVLIQTNLTCYIYSIFSCNKKKTMWMSLLCWE